MQEKNVNTDFFGRTPVNMKVLVEKMSKERRLQKCSDFTVQHHTD